ncbi:MAG: YbbR-like domain-containing protein [Candidatus Omnitrophica bacterium]|nr:YbbR-like domain-containing protein [Candidatus Omnitrophota bacterium]
MRPPGRNLNFIAVALVLAVVTYVYVHHEVVKDQVMAPDASYRLIKLTAKTVPVKVRFASNPPEGFRLHEARVRVNPQEITIVGPEALLEESAYAETAIVDISQTRQKTTKAIPLESVAGIHLTGEPQIVEVTIPVEPLEADA